MNPKERSWIFIENVFHPSQLHYYETILTQGNGYLGTRATFEEGYPNEMPSTLVHGIFNHHADDLVPDLANVPMWFAMQIEVDDETFRLDRGKVRGYERTLDLRNGVLKRGVLWQTTKGQVLRFEFERFVSMADPHALAQRVTITALSDVENLRCIAYLDQKKAENIAYATEGPKQVSHWTNVQTGTMSADRSWWQAKTSQSDYQVRLEQHIQTDHPNAFLSAHETAGGMGNGFSTLSLKIGESVTITRLVSIFTSRDGDDFSVRTSEHLDQLVVTGYDGIRQANDVAWQNLWNDMDIVIEGDEYAQLAIRFVTYHLLITASQKDERVSIGAKTLSGPGYKGHVFWDTELFMLPPFTFSKPAIARNLLMYRYHNLAGAREKAAEAGYKGAMFPWESTDTGKETTPRWTLPDEKGNRIRIWTGDHEQHISSDIAYAIWQYWQWTGDDDFMCDYGAEMILDTAVFWASRVEWNAALERYELNLQIGPDEFHENINNSVYTNRLTVWHLEHAIKTLAWLETHHADKAVDLSEQLGINALLREKWQHIIQKMYIPRHAERNVYEQFDGYFEKNVVELEKYSPRTTNMDVILGHEASNASQVIKQADVVMLIALLGDALGDRDELLRNWNAYLPNTAHDSSLSPAIYAWVGAQLGLTEKAYELWYKAAGIDLHNNKGNVRDGIHAAACGGLRQAVMLGFAGLQLDSDGNWKTEPRLPDWWRSVSFSFYHRGQRHHITVNNS